MITLVLGGARSGKSSIAERLTLKHEGPLYYLATAEITDDDMAERIERHRRSRDDRFETIEAGPDLAAAVTALDERPALVDTLGTWLARHADFVVDVDELCGALAARTAPTVIVSDEVGSSVHPETPVGRLFRDCLGDLNQRIAAISSDVYLCVAGRIVPLRPSSDFGI